jgi:hypothetical protein
MWVCFAIVILTNFRCNLQPERSVLEAMNQINTQRRLREAAFEKAEADKVVMIKVVPNSPFKPFPLSRYSDIEILLYIKRAEAEAESKYLSGVGLARMRTAIAEGYKDTIKSMTDGNDALSPHDVVHMMLTTQ